jgi:chemotaxis protein CheZ
MAMAKPYRIERKKHAALGGSLALVPDLGTQSQHESLERDVYDDPRIAQIIETLKELRGFLDPSQRMATYIIDTYKRELTEINALRVDIDAMKQAIEATKYEIASLHVTENSGDGMRRVSGELDAVVNDTERAITAILAATEDIETQAGILRAVMGKASEPLEIIQERVIQLYESCNFQDLTGQRITKIVRTLGFVESRLDKMIQVWGGIEAFKDFEDKAQPFQAFTGSTMTDATLLNGPRLEEDAGHVSQDDIDALFQ